MGLTAPPVPSYIRQSGHGEAMGLTAPPVPSYIRQSGHSEAMGLTVPPVPSYVRQLGHGEAKGLTVPLTYDSRSMVNQWEYQDPSPFKYKRQGMVKQLSSSPPSHTQTS